MNYTSNKLYWFFRNTGNKLDCIGFIYNESLGALIIGGPTGTHMTGHGESWKDKLNEVLSNNYIDETSAFHHKLISNEWNPPLLNEKELLLLNKFIK